MPLPPREANGSHHLDLTLVLFLIIETTFQILDEVLDHGDDDNDKERDEDSWSSLGEGDGWDYL